MNSRQQAEFRDFVATRGPALFRFAYALTGSQHAAEDLLQAALEKVVARWRRIDDPEPYVKRTLYNLHASSWRRAIRRPERLVPDLPERITTVDETATVDLRHTMTAAIDQLPPRQRAIVVLRYLEDLSEHDVARILNCSPSTVSSQLSRALVQLRAIYRAPANDSEEVRPR